MMENPKIVIYVMGKTETYKYLMLKRFLRKCGCESVPDRSFLDSGIHEVIDERKFNLRNIKNISM